MEPRDHHRPTVDRESVRVLAIELGAREAARRLGLNRNTVISWARRYNWNLPKRAGRPAIVPATDLHTQPGDVLLEELARNEKQTKLNLARTGSKLSEALAASAEVKDARNALDITRMAALLHGWKSQDEKITISHSQVILTSADIKELQQLHKQALLKAGSESESQSDNPTNRLEP